MSKSLSIILLLFFTINSFSQDVISVIKTDRIETEDGVEYYVHTVVKGQTLYSISKVYDVAIDKIIEINPDAKLGLRTGQELWVPVPDKSEEEIKQTSQQENFVYHFVKQGETLYSISKIYQVEIAKIKETNPEIKEDIKEGSYLKIPLDTDYPEIIAEGSYKIGGKQATDDVGEIHNVFNHRVETQETLFSISRKYDVTVDAIKETNPGLTETLSVGQILKIPSIQSGKTTTTTTTTTTTAAADPAAATAAETPLIQTDTIIHIIHKVRRGETVESIADEYMIGVGDIYFMNPGSELGVEKNQKLKIPLQPLGIDEVIKPDTLKKTMEGAREEDDIYLDKHAFCDNLEVDKEFRIALMMPLYLDDVDSINVDDQAEIMPAGFYKSFRFLPFYQGLLIALDSMRKAGLNVKLYVHDITSDTVRTHKILKEPAMKDLDLIIGLVYSYNFNIVSRFAKENDIKIVHPISNRSEIIKNNPHVFKVMASPDTQLEELAEFLAEKYCNDNILIIYNSTQGQKNDLAKLEKALNKSIRLRVADTCYKSIACDRDGVINIKGHLNDTKKNILVTLSSDQAFVINYLRQLNTWRGDYELIVFGMPSWEKFKSLETKYILNLNLHLYSNLFIDYSDDDVKAFIKQYRKRFEAEPDVFSFQGFDIGIYFLTALKKYGKYFDECIPLLRMNSLLTNYFFKKRGNDGYENSFLNIYKYEDHRLVDARKVNESDEENLKE